MADYRYLVNVQDQFKDGAPRFLLALAMLRQNVPDAKIEKDLHMSAKKIESLKNAYEKGLV